MFKLKQFIVYSGWVVIFIFLVLSSIIIFIIVPSAKEDALSKIPIIESISSFKVDNVDINVFEFEGRKYIIAKYGNSVSICNEK